MHMTKVVSNKWMKYLHEKEKARDNVEHDKWIFSAQYSAMPYINHEHYLPNDRDWKHFRFVWKKIVD